MSGNYGFIREKIEIKILLLFILRRITEPIDFDALTRLVMCDDGIGYFEYAECVAELVKTGHIQLEEGKYSITAKGVRNGGITENNLPFTVRMKADREVYAARMGQSRDAMIKTSHRAEPNGGYKVDLALSDGIGEIVKMELLANDERQAATLEDGFRRNAERVYHALIEMLIDNR